MSDASLGPYVSRLVASGERSAHELEGTLVALDIFGFAALSQRLQAKGRGGAEELAQLISETYEQLVRISDGYGGEVLEFTGDLLLLFFSAGSHHRLACDAASEMLLRSGDSGARMSSVGPFTLQMSVGVSTVPCHFFLVDGAPPELFVTGPAATEVVKMLSEAGREQIDAGADPSKANVVPLELSVLEPNLGVEHFASDPSGARFVPGPHQPEHRRAVVGCLKFAGVDQLIAREGKESAHERISAVAKLVGDTCAELGLTRLRSDIDAEGGNLLLISGGPSSMGKDEEQMLRALRTVLDEHTVLPDAGPISFRAGASRGTVFCGDVGRELRRTYIVMGEPVSLAARFAGRAAAGQILATGDVLDRARSRYHVSRAQAFLIVGKELPLTVYSVGAAIGERKEETPSELPVVGRDAELASLAAAVDAARRREQRLVELIGEAGIGKSRLVEELKKQASGFTQLVARCESYGAATPYFTLRRLLRQLVGIDVDLDEAAAGAHLELLVRSALPDLARWLPLLAVPFGAQVSSTREADSIEADFRRQRLHEVVEEFLTRMLVMPTLIVLEDTHWVDDASHDFIRHMTRQPAARPWLLCVSRRPYGGAVAQDVSGHTALALQPLDDAVAQSLAVAAAGDLALSTDALRTVCERSGGNPLFVRELVGAVRNTGRTDTLPESVEHVISSRIATLAREDRSLLSDAAVLGTRFALDVLAEVLADDLEQVADLARWERLAEFVAWESAGELRFRHDLIRDVSYEAMTSQRRRHLHGRVATVLARRGSDPSLLSLHFFEAQQYQQAWGNAKEAAERARTQYANVLAADLYERALAAADHLDLPAPDVAEAYEALGDVAALVTDYDKAVDAYERAGALIGVVGRLFLKEGRILERRGRYDEALNSFRRASAHAEDEDTRFEADIAYASVLFRQAEYDEAIEKLRGVVEGAEAADNRAVLAHACYNLDAAYTHVGHFDPTWCERARAIYEELGDMKGLGVVLNNLGIHAYYSGNFADALEFYARSRDVRERMGDVEGATIAMNNEAEILSDQGRYDEAERLFRDVLRISTAAGNPMMATVAMTNLGRIASHRGRFDEAHRFLDEAAEKLRDIGSEGLAVEADLRRVECFVLEGRHGEALELVEDTLARATELGRLATLGPALERWFGYALSQSERSAEAWPHFEESLRLGREARAEYQVALTLRALEETSRTAADESEELLHRLGVVATPAVPLP